MLTLVKQLYIRSGKEEYVRKNNTYGISSLEKRHVKITDDTIKFKFNAKSG